MILSKLVPYHSCTNIGKNLDTLGKLMTYPKKIDIFNWNFAELHLRYCCLTWMELDILTTFDILK